MSYCRWSSVCEDNFSSDLYIFDHVGGYIEVMVAANRCVGDDEGPAFSADMEKQNFAEFLKQYDARIKYMRHLPMQKIDLPHAGETFQFTDPAKCVAFLRELKELGYHMPSRVLDVETFRPG